VIGAVLAGITLALVGPVLGVLIRRRRRPPATVPAGWDECEVCAEPATHEVRETYTNDGELAGWDGGTSCSATYCAEHRPDGAVPLRR
jgi:hypothetical protein